MSVEDYEPNKNMKLLIIDGLNFLMHRFPSVWSMSFDVIKKELDCLAFACKQVDVMPLIVLDLYRSDNCGEQKWRRRQKKLLIRNRAVPCSASCLIGTILAETDIPWTYATTMEADDLIIEIAQKVNGCTVLSGDKGYLRTDQRSFCVARGCAHLHGYKLVNVTHATPCRCNEDVALPSDLKFHQNLSKIDFYINEIKRHQVVKKGVFYTSFSTLPCLWCFLQHLREHMYKCIGVSRVEEMHVCANMCQSTKRLFWKTCLIDASFTTDDIWKSCVSAVQRFKQLSWTYSHASSSDHENAVFACAVTVAQILTDIWFVQRTNLDIVDSLTASRKFRYHLKCLLDSEIS